MDIHNGEAFIYADIQPVYVYVSWREGVGGSGEGGVGFLAIEMFGIDFGRWAAYSRGFGERRW